MNNTEYVCGFAFNEQMNKVALITKNRPKFLAGKTNGIGGKVEEGESPPEAMVREFEEEAGVKTNVLEWQILGKLTFPLGNVVFYMSILDDDRFYDIKTMTDEEINIEHVNDIMMTDKFLMMEVDGYLYFLSALSRGASNKQLYVRYEE